MKAKIVCVVLAVFLGLGAWFSVNQITDLKGQITEQAEQIAQSEVQVKNQTAQIVELEEESLETTRTQCEKLATEDIITELRGYGIIVEENPDFSEFPRWIRGAEKAISFLPRDVQIDITRQKNALNPYYLTISFIKFESFEWATGLYIFGYNEIEINTAPNPEHPFPFERPPENGYTDEEILFCFLHEMGHSWDFSRSEDLASSSKSYQEILEKEESPSLYACYYTDCFSGELKKSEGINEMEDFAESFTFYVLLPEYLKKNFPLRYAWFKDYVFGGLEYESIPSSEKARLTKPLNC
ncbi:MAG: hypothetical protein CO031_00710 [Candidatus Nealsonbacteria bacterium CG_4_9_14_0_2_um_filter_37_38]|nr:MAG: hypothetical protein CO031_00710 [Candidatus Nealsonbacteria bacterium CG_4_9_14_0_2_um_filter_37_38]